MYQMVLIVYKYLTNYYYFKYLNDIQFGDGNTGRFRDLIGTLLTIYHGFMLKGYRDF